MVTMFRVCAVLLCCLVASACAQDTIESMLESAHALVRPLDSINTALQALEQDFDRETSLLHQAADPADAYEKVPQISRLYNMFVVTYGVGTEDKLQLAEAMLMLYDAVRYTARYMSRIAGRTREASEETVSEAFGVIDTTNQQIQEQAGGSGGAGGAGGEPNACGEDGGNPGFYSFRGHCYAMSSAPAQFYEIWTYGSCDNMNMHYMKIDSQEEQDFIANVIENDYGGVSHWVGLRATPSTHYDWMLDNTHDVDGYQNWDVNQPDEAQQCGYFGSATSYKWHTASCETPQRYVCESMDPAK